ncbi:MAG: hypothetical protein RMM58_02745 [Chloroflexota bacterium]|nr:hypothetical protein [Dehalococcoidia bacterium]MDW8252775.1 hypothetical protein [Chloroflexota bacterium]
MVGGRSVTATALRSREAVMLERIAAPPTAGDPVGLGAVTSAVKAVRIHNVSPAVAGRYPLVRPIVIRTGASAAAAGLFDVAARPAGPRPSGQPR